MKKNNIKTIIILSILAALFIFPFYWLVIGTTKNVSQLFQKSLLPGIPNHFIENTLNVFSYEQGVFFHWLLNSLLYAGVGAFVGVFLSSLAGYSFRRYYFPGKKILFIIILGFSMVPVYATTLPLFMIFSDLNLIDTRWAVLLPSFVNIFGTYLMIAYWNQVPQELFDSAAIDGANDFTTFFRIGLPNVLPGFITLFILAFIGIWNNFFLPLVLLNSRAKMPLVLGITTMVDPQGYPIYNLTLTASMYAVIPLFILFFSLQRYFKPQLGGVTR